MSLFQDLHQLWTVLIPCSFLVAAVIDQCVLSRLGKVLPEAVAQGRKFIRLLRYGLITSGLILSVAAMMRPGWGHSETTPVKMRGRDIVFLVDVSQSMLARDLVPDRLGRARADILRLIPSLEGDRVALVAFSGTPVLKCPLTTDYHFFRQGVNGLDTRSVSIGGTRMSDALEFVASRVFDDKASARRDLILITDGGEMGQNTEKAVRKLSDKGIRMIILGMGNDITGSPIPVVDNSGNETELTWQGTRVLTTMDRALLVKLAEMDPDFRFVPVASGMADLVQIYRTWIKTAPESETGTVNLEQKPERFAWFLLPALILFFLEFLLRFLPLVWRTGKRGAGT